MKNLEIKELTLEYVESYINLLKNCFNNVADHPMIEKMLADKNITTIIAVDSKKVVGAITIDKRFNYLKNIKFYILENVCTDDAYRGKHIATNILKEVEKRAIANQISYISFTSGNNRTIAHKFYLKNNYKIKDTSVFVKYFNK